MNKKMNTETHYVINKPTSVVFTDSIKNSRAHELCIDSDITSSLFGTVVHIKSPEMYREINQENGKNKIIIFVTKKQLENRLNWHCYMEIAIDLLVQETDFEDYTISQTKSCRTTLIFDIETYKLYCQQTNFRDINEFVNKHDNPGMYKFNPTTLNNKLCFLKSLCCRVSVTNKPLL